VSAAAGVVAHATCLGCGCACDDIVVRTEGERIVDAERACPLGRAWFGDGRVPARATVRGADAPDAEALDARRRSSSAPRGRSCTSRPSSRARRSGRASRWPTCCARRSTP
jgi:hypothetical protein